MAKQLRSENWISKYIFSLFILLCCIATLRKLEDFVLSYCFHIWTSLGVSRRRLHLQPDHALLSQIIPRLVEEN